MNHSVYLAGPITGLSYDGACDWRLAAIDYLGRREIAGLSPMRGKSFLSNVKDIPAHVVGGRFSSPQSITSRDRWDCQRADLVIMNLLKADRVSIGTCVEMGWCDMARTPVILVMEENGMHEHPILSTLAAFRTDNLDEALEMAVIILKGK